MQVPLAVTSPPAASDGGSAVPSLFVSSVLGVPLRPEGKLGLQFPLNETAPWLAVTLKAQQLEHVELLELVPCEDPETPQELAYTRFVRMAGR
jgi:hypothetical protein